MLRRILLTLAEQKWLYRLIVGNGVFRRMAFRFVAGETLEEALAAVERLNARGIMASLDCLGENVSTPAEAERARDEYLAALDAIKARGLDANVSLKLTQMGFDLDPGLCLDNVRRIVGKASDYGNFVRIDMEGSGYTQATLDLFRRLWAEGPVRTAVGVVIQAYLLRSARDIADLNAMGARVRLCKGAYSEPPSIAFARKADTDATYRQLAEALLTQGTYPGLATHDPRLIKAIRDLVRERGIDRSGFEYQMLYGIRRDLQEQLVAEGYRLRVYVPYGAQWYAYFMRRLAERPANVLFFLTALLHR